jgi:uncharacterized membrane protein
MLSGISGRNRLLCAALAAAGMLPALAQEQATFRLLWVNESRYISGNFYSPPGTPSIHSESYMGMSADGSVLIGEAEDIPPFGTLIIGNRRSAQSFRQVDDVREFLGPMPDSQAFAEPVDISADGRVVVGSGGGWQMQLIGSDLPSKGPQAFRWTAQEGTQLLFAPDATASSFARAVSADGSVIVGYYDQGRTPRRGFRWTTQGVMSLDPLPGDLMAMPEDVSGDGAVTTGTSYDWVDNTSYVTHACMWADGKIPTALGSLGGLVPLSEALAISADGKTIVGSVGDRMSKQLAFRWTADGGMQALGDISPSAAYVVSADGSVIAGMSNGEAFRWDAVHGKQPLGALLRAAGADLQDFEPGNVIAISADGRTFLGWSSMPYRGMQLAFGHMTNRTAVWLAHLPEVPSIPQVDTSSAYQYVPPQETNPETIPAPRLGKRKILLRGSRLLITGVARGNVTEVGYRIGKDGVFKTAAGTNFYRIVARATPGRTFVTIIARGPGGDSEPLNLVIGRRTESR